MPNSDSMLKWSTFSGQKFPWSNILFLPIKNSFRIWESKGQERKEENRKKSNLSWLYCHVYYHRMEFQRHTIQLTSQVTQVKIQVQDFGFLNCEILNITYIVEVENLFFFFFFCFVQFSVVQSLSLHLSNAIAHTIRSLFLVTTELTIFKVVTQLLNSVKCIVHEHELTLRLNREENRKERIEKREER